MADNRDQKTFSKFYDVLEGSAYIPGLEPPPIAEDWTYHHSEYHWMIEVQFLGSDSCSRGKIQSIKTRHKPIVRDGVLMWVWGDPGEEYTQAINIACVKTFSIKKYETEVFYKLEGLVVPTDQNEKAKYKVNYLRFDPKMTYDGVSFE